MDITLEKVERLREKAGVTYAQAKEALDYSGGDLLDALIYLEEQGTIPRQEGAYYSTRGETPVTCDGEQSDGEEAESREQEKRSLFDRIRFWLTENELEIWYKEKPVTAMPALVMILLLVLAAWAVIPLAVLGLLFGFRVRFAGPESDRDELDSPGKPSGDTASELGRRVMDELRSQQPKEEQASDNKEERGV